jgi:hypothetical protein
MKDDHPPPPPIFVSYADDDIDGGDDDQSIGGYRGLQGEQREESPSIMDEISSLAMAPEVVRPRSCHHHWRVLSAPSEVVGRESAVAATAAEQSLPLLFDHGGVEVQRTTPSKDLRSTSPAWES